MTAAGQDRPTFLADSIDVVRDGEQITVWNRLTVEQHHAVRAGEVETHHTVLVGDGSLRGKAPDYITPEMDAQLRSLDVYPNAEVVDPASDEVSIV